MRVLCHGPDANVQVFSAPFTAADRELADEEIASYLIHARIPEPPQNLVWLIRRPPAFDNDRQFWSYLNEHIAHHTSPAPPPSEIASLLQRTMAMLYADRS